MSRSVGCAAPVNIAIHRTHFEQHVLFPAIYTITEFTGVQGTPAAPCTWVAKFTVSNGFTSANIHTALRVFKPSNTFIRLSRSIEVDAVAVWRVEFVVNDCNHFQRTRKPHPIRRRPNSSPEDPSTSKRFRSQSFDDILNSFPVDDTIFAQDQAYIDRQTLQDSLEEFSRIKIEY